jgi:hypothetical protein
LEADKCLIEVTAGKAARDMKTGVWQCKELLHKHDIKIDLKNKRVVVKRRTQYFVFMTADTSKVDTETKAWYMEERFAICQQ